MFAIAPRPVHELVEKVAEGLNPPEVKAKSFAGKVPAKNLDEGSAEALAYASNLPETVLFAGFLGGLVEQPNGRKWQVLYLDLELNERLLIENEGIVASSSVVDDAVPFKKTRDLIWVKADAAVGGGGASQSVETQFLTGDFTRAGDCEAPPQGGTIAAATGIFCQARTASCCYGPRSRR